MTNTTLAVSATLVLLVAATPETKAGEQPGCDEQAMSTVELNQRADRAFGEADEELNAAYRRALASIEGLATEPPFDAKSWEDALRNSQRAWIAFRDAECKGHVPMSWTGGTGTTSAVLGCLTAKTRERTKELGEQYDPQ